MAEIIYLKAEQIGELAADGGILKHPEFDTDGQPYQWSVASRKHVTIDGKPCFVVLAPGKDRPDVEYKAQAAPAVTKPAKGGE
jgi:hypothetical protein